MKRFAITLAFLLAFVLKGNSQNIGQDISIGPFIDSTYALSSVVDSTYAGKNIFDVLARKSIFSSVGKVEIDQPESVRSAMAGHIANAPSRKIQGYRIRIFFDNKQTARATSESVMGGFMAAHPGIGVYREYANPYFKVTVGDFRTKADAQSFLSSIKSSYPSGFIVKETINFPVL